MKAGVAFAAAVLSFATVGLQAQEKPQGEPVTDVDVRDAEFGVSARHFGLERRVAMLQWQAVGDGHALVWSEEPIDSHGFPDGKANPADIPLPGKQWIAPITIDGKPVAPEVIERLGQWRGFRPNFSALPGNLAATFQPEGDGLGSADNPLDPQVGDLRIDWRELTLPPLADKVELREGRWVLARGTEADATTDAAATSPTPARGPWLLGGGALLLALLGFAFFRRRR